MHLDVDEGGHGLTDLVCATVSVSWTLNQSIGGGVHHSLSR